MCYESDLEMDTTSTVTSAIIETDAKQIITPTLPTNTLNLQPKDVEEPKEEPKEDPTNSKQTPINNITNKLDDNEKEGAKEIEDIEKKDKKKDPNSSKSPNLTLEKIKKKSLTINTNNLNVDKEKVISPKRKIPSAGSFIKEEKKKNKKNQK